MAEPAPELALAAIYGELVRLGRRFALVGGLAVSVRAEVRFTRDVDIVVSKACTGPPGRRTCEAVECGRAGCFRGPVTR
jgi:hypothetical protein